MYSLVLFNNKTVGRDKLARLIQYASKLTWHILLQHNATGSSVAKIQELEYMLSNFRRLLRMGRCLDTLYGALKLIRHDDTLVSVHCAISRISYSLYLLCDHIIWFGRSGFVNTDSNRWGRIANKYWLLTITVNLMRDYVEFKRLFSSGKIALKYNRNFKILARNVLLICDTHKDLLLDFLKNSCDIFLPLAALNYVKLSPGTVGLLGVVSSVVGIYTIVDPMAKLPLS